MSDKRIELQLKEWANKQSAFIERLQREAFDDAFKQQLAERAIKIIVARTRKGIGVDNDQGESQQISNQLLPGLAPFTIERRKNIVLGKFARPDRSNLTMTGQMLEDLTFELIQEGVRVVFKNKQREPTRTKDGKVYQDNNANEQIARYLSQNDFKWLAISKDERKILISLVQRRLTATARRLAGGQ